MVLQRLLEPKTVLAGGVVAVCACVVPSMATAAPMKQVVVRIRFTGHSFQLRAGDGR